MSNYTQILSATLLTTCLVLFALTPQTVQAQNVYFLINSLSGKCIDVAGAPGTQNGSPLILWDCEKSGFNKDNGSRTDQTWIPLKDGFIQHDLSGKCIDVAGAPGQKTGDKLQLWDCELSGFSANGAPSDQKWIEVKGGYIKNVVSGLCIDVRGLPGTRNGDPIQLAPCEILFTTNGSVTDQKWQSN